MIKKSVINQREIGIDVWSYKDALKQFALHSPDVIYIGNIRDVETCHAALTIAQTGVLVFLLCIQSMQLRQWRE